MFLSPLTTNNKDVLYVNGIEPITNGKANDDIYYLDRENYSYVKKAEKGILKDDSGEDHYIFVGGSEETKKLIDKDRQGAIYNLPKGEALAVCKLKYTLKKVA